MIHQKKATVKFGGDLMPLINSQEDIPKDRIKIELQSELVQEIKAYMNWANVKDMDFFFKEAANLVLTKDRDWKKYKKGDRQPKAK